MSAQRQCARWRTQPGRPANFVTPARLLKETDQGVMRVLVWDIRKMESTANLAWNQVMSIKQTTARANGASLGRGRIQIALAVFRVRAFSTRPMESARTACTLKF